MALASCQCNKAGLRMPYAQESGGFVCGRCGLRISQTHVAACPECAEKDAELRRELAAARNDLAAAWRELDKTRERVCYLERLVRDAILLV